LDPDIFLFSSSHKTQLKILFVDSQINPSQVEKTEYDRVKFKPTNQPKKLKTNPSKFKNQETNPPEFIKKNGKQHPNSDEN